MIARLCLILFLALFAGSPAFAEQYFVKNHAEYFAAAKKVQAGDVIILANGNWQDFEIVLTGKGTKDKPIVLISENPGKVVITGKSNLRIGGEYILVTGLVFLNGSSPTGECTVQAKRWKNPLWMQPLRNSWRTYSSASTVSCTVWVGKPYIR